MKKKALVLAGGLPQIKLINELKSRGYYVILVDYSLSPIAERFADKFYRESTLDVPMVTQIAIKENADIIITCCTDQALSTVSSVSAKLGLPCYIDERTGLSVTNKKEMKSILYANRIPTSRFVITDNSDIDIDLKYPVVVKPVDCNSSKGVTKVYSESELKQTISDSISYSRGKNAIVEEYVEGKEVSVDAFVVEGKVHLLCT